MPKGAKSAKTCTLDMLKQDGSVPQMSFFKAKHMKGFWPFTVNTEEEEIELAVSVLSTCFQRNFLNRFSLLVDGGLISFCFVSSPLFNERSS